ncbi:hypothetical protein FACS1894122_08240 [Alphaproteobacteria bacterium]|nr:hypothetical protein FACS1894122_08240 [Alphaproteobacteria bacterium]
MQLSSVKKCIPNVLTVIRILLAFLFGFLIFKNEFLWAEIVFVLAAISDFFDGFLARRWKVISEFGTTVDPLADKLLMTVSYLVFFYIGVIPGYLCAIVLGRDILIVSVVLLCKVLDIKLKIAPLKSSKVNTCTQLIYIIFILACNYQLMNVPMTWELWLGSIIVSLSTIVSGIHYAIEYRWIIKDVVCKNKR